MIPIGILIFDNRRVVKIRYAFYFKDITSKLQKCSKNALNLKALLNCFRVH